MPVITRAAAKKLAAAAAVVVDQNHTLAAAQSVGTGATAAQPVVTAPPASQSFVLTPAAAQPVAPNSTSSLSIASGSTTIPSESSPPLAHSSGGLSSPLSPLSSLQALQPLPELQHSSGSGPNANATSNSKELTVLDYLVQMHMESPNADDPIPGIWSEEKGCIRVIFDAEVEPSPRAKAIEAYEDRMRICKIFVDQLKLTARREQKPELLEYLKELRGVDREALGLGPSGGRDTEDLDSLFDARSEVGDIDMGDHSQEHNSSSDEQEYMDEDADSDEDDNMSMDPEQYAQYTYTHAGKYPSSSSSYHHAPVPTLRPATWDSTSVASAPSFVQALAVPSGQGYGGRPHFQVIGGQALTTNQGSNLDVY